MKRFLAAILSVPLFATVITILHILHSLSNDYSVQIKGMFVLHVFFAGPIVLIVNLVLSIIIDYCIESPKRTSSWAKYIVRLGLYSLFGIIVGILISAAFEIKLELMIVLFYGLMGFIASNCYFHLSLLLSKISRGNSSSLTSVE